MFKISKAYISLHPNKLETWLNLALGTSIFAAHGGAKGMYPGGHIYFQTKCSHSLMRNQVHAFCCHTEKNDCHITMCKPYYSKMAKKIPSIYTTITATWWCTFQWHMLVLWVLSQGYFLDTFHQHSQIYTPRMFNTSFLQPELHIQQRSHFIATTH